MPNNKTGLLLAAFMVAHQIGSPAGAAIPSGAIQEIREMVRQSEVDELRTYIAANPWLTSGDSPLARALEEFLDDSSGILKSLGFVSNKRALSELASVTFQEGIY